ncbi:MAG: hypothetical protein JW772_00860 [Candidatus Diapherotrites archaeon]|nr:hypothetical protein [Candidatus Diapherotrites archaeon]
MLFEFFHSLMSLDINWFVTLIGNNLIWLFMFTALIFFFFNGKKVVAGVIVFSLVAWAWMDFETYGGIVIFAGGFLAIYYITKLAVLMFAENTPELSSKLIWITEIHGILLIVAYNIFMR